MSSHVSGKPIEILLVEDDPGDVRLARETLKDAKVRNNLHVVGDGVEAIDFVRQEGKYTDAVRPDLILLDLNLPKKDGREVLAEIKTDNKLKTIPVIVLTVSETDEDILQAYDLQANCYISKPVDAMNFISVVKILEDLWLTVVKLPLE